ncbi:MAG: hypothetical protein H0U67_16610 [Gemmatimonadetes bacterium]|nr:hypothetical protein [Gemmatimonadota bacterium]
MPKRKRPPFISKDEHDALTEADLERARQADKEFFDQFPIGVGTLKFKKSRNAPPRKRVPQSPKGGGTPY